METAKNKIKRINQKKEKYMFKNKKCSTVWSKECPIFYIQEYKYGHQRITSQSIL